MLAGLKYPVVTPANNEYRYTRWSAGPAHLRLHELIVIGRIPSLGERGGGGGGRGGGGEWGWSVGGRQEIRTLGSRRLE